MTTGDIIKAHLDAHGFDGLVNTLVPCGCGKDDLAPCGCIDLGTCQPAYLTTATADDAEWLDVSEGDEMYSATKRTTP